MRLETPASTSRSSRSCSRSGQRHTACMRYISAPQRSQRTLSSARAGAEFEGVMGRTGLRGGVGSDIGGLSHSDRRPLATFDETVYDDSQSGKLHQQNCRLAALYNTRCFVY